MKKTYIIIAAIVLTAVTAAYRVSGGGDESGNFPALIPVPVSVQPGTGHFNLAGGTTIYYSTGDLKPLASYLEGMIEKITGLDIRTAEGTGKGISIRAEGEAANHPEGYKMEVTSKRISLSAPDHAGLFYGMQTLLQMVPVEKNGTSLLVPAATIEDYPRFKWRGILLDVSRHFFTIDEVKKLIDQMAMYKFNLLQLHLTDDQGWRIEIKKLPELTAVGAWRVPRTGLWWDRECAADGEAPTYGGFYTQDQVRDLVKYAAERHIDILPEIEAPGHSLAAIAAYPHLSSTGLKYKVNPGCKFYTIDDNSLCAGKESTYEYLNTVLTEVAELFPFEYIHIGGDECYKGFWKKCADCQQKMKENGLKNEDELQSYLIKRLEKMLQEKGKKLIGWDEILEGGLAPNATVMSWRGMKGGIIAAKEGHHVVMSPTTHAYLDLYQGDPAIEPPTYSMLRLNSVYEFEPVPEGVAAELILGGQGNLWTESIPTFRQAEYMLWPRSFALAEVLWSPPSARNWKSFIERTEKHLDRLSSFDINYSVSFRDAIITPKKNSSGDMVISLGSEIDGVDLYYTFDGTYPDHHSPKYKPGEEISIPKDADTFRVITYNDGKPFGRIITVPLEDLKKRIRK